MVVFVSLACKKFLRYILYLYIFALYIISERFAYNSGVKQGCKLAPTLYGIYAAILLLLEKPSDTKSASKFGFDTTAIFSIWKD